MRESIVRSWGRLIFEYLGARPRAELSYADIQDALDMPSGPTFNNAMAEARRLAKAQDHCIAFCFESDGSLVLAFDPNDVQLAASIERRGTAINGQVVNLVDQLEWGGRHAQDAWLRSYCMYSAEAHRGMGRAQDALSNMSGALLKKVRAKTGP
jgi:hypothetical protein